MTQPSPLLTAPEVAEYLRTTERHLKDLRRTGELPAANVGRKVRYRWSAIERYLERQEAASA